MNKKQKVTDIKYLEMRDKELRQYRGLPELLIEIVVQHILRWHEMEKETTVHRMADYHKGQIVGAVMVATYFLVKSGLTSQEKFNKEFENLLNFEQTLMERKHETVH
ncbi:MAG: hypothetical protein LBU45_01010 [Azoarcus sp.]|jgi:hypothetical protein|nr:hypothetical protein [Azoarcus sp.]